MNNDLTKEEAFKLSAEQGVAITHRYFTHDEYIKVLTNNYIRTEEGYQTSLEEWDRDRPQEAWNTGWSVYQD